MAKRLARRTRYPAVQGPGFESRFDHYLNLFHGFTEFKSSTALVSSHVIVTPEIN